MEVVDMIRFIAVCLVVFACACTPAPKDVRCTNQADCKAVNERYGYCMQNRCVECLGDPGCGEGNVCREGLCVHKCFERRDCDKGQACVDGFCEAEM